MIDIEIITEPPKVFVIGKSVPNWDAVESYLNHRGVRWNTEAGWASDTEAILEAAGRVCYQSWENKRRSTRDVYLRSSIIEHGHGSVLEHVWFNCLVADLPRSVQLELVRHGEGTAFSFESQRFTDTHLRFVAPPLIRKDSAAMRMFTMSCYEAQSAYQKACELGTNLIEQASISLEDKTLRRKRVKEAARSLLPNCVGSDGMFSLNARAARHIIHLRTDEHADASIREFAAALYHALRDDLPAVFSDAKLENVSFGPHRVAFVVGKV